MTQLVKNLLLSLKMEHYMNMRTSLTNCIPNLGCLNHKEVFSVRILQRITNLKNCNF